MEFKRQRLSSNGAVPIKENKWLSLNRNPWVHIFSFCSWQEHCAVLTRVSKSHRGWSKSAGGWPQHINMLASEAQAKELIKAGIQKVAKLDVRLGKRQGPYDMLTPDPAFFEVIQPWSKTLRELRIVSGILPGRFGSVPSVPENTIHKILTFMKQCPDLQVYEAADYSDHVGSRKVEWLLSQPNIRKIDTYCYMVPPLKIPSVQTLTHLHLHSMWTNSRPELPILQPMRALESLALDLRDWVDARLPDWDSSVNGKFWLTKKDFPSLKHLRLTNTRADALSFPLDPELVQNQLETYEIAGWSWAPSAATARAEYRDLPGLRCGLADGSKSIQAADLCSVQQDIWIDDLPAFIDRLSALRVIKFDVRGMMSPLEPVDELLKCRPGRVDIAYAYTEAEAHKKYQAEKARPSSNKKKNPCVIFVCNLNNARMAKQQQQQ